jgi:hypothetical protein
MDFTLMHRLSMPPDGMEYRDYGTPRWWWLPTLYSEADDGTWRGPTQGKPTVGIANLRLQCFGKQLKGEIVISEFDSGEMTAQVSGEFGDDNRFEAVWNRLASNSTCICATNWKSKRPLRSSNTTHLGGMDNGYRSIRNPIPGSLPTHAKKGF